MVGGFILFSLHMTMVWNLTNGAGNPAPNDGIIDVCVSVVRRGWGFQINRRAEGRGLGHRADKRKPSFLAQARKTTSSER